MARGWRVLDATSFDGRVGGVRGRITFESDLIGVRGVAAEDVAVLLLGAKATVTPSALHYASKHGIAMLFTDWKGVPFGGLYPWSDHTRVGARHLAQAEVSVPRRKNAWQQIVRAKVLGQAKTLEGVDPAGADRIRQLARQIRSGDPGNVEGVAARLYWSRLFGLAGPFVRDQDGEDSINGMLNYGYTVLRGFGIRAVVGAGLSPAIGVFHRGRSNFFNLVDDLIEPFRPAVDYSVLRLGPAASLEDSTVKQAVVATASQPYRSDGTRIPAALDDLAQQLGRYFEGDLARLQVPHWQGPVVSAEVTSNVEG